MQNLKRPIQAMPEFVRQALEDRRLTERYKARPAYQRNDYLWWITSAKRTETKRRRLEKMIKELQAGTGYMGMDWKPR